jgi:hypothetical protein
MVELHHRAASGAGQSDAQPCREAGPSGIPKSLSAGIEDQVNRRRIGGSEVSSSGQKSLDLAQLFRAPLVTIHFGLQYKGLVVQSADSTARDLPRSHRQSPQ